MNWKVIVIVSLILVLVFSHYINKHNILVYGRKLDESRELYQAQRVDNLNLITMNSKLSSRERIQRLASQQLSMFYPANNDNVHDIRFDHKKNTFRILDYIIPSAEALTR